jgi:hypothetical protein
LAISLFSIGKVCNQAAKLARGETGTRFCQLSSGSGHRFRQGLRQRTNARRQAPLAETFPPAKAPWYLAPPAKRGDRAGFDRSAIRTGAIGRLACTGGKRQRPVDAAQDIGKAYGGRRATQHIASCRSALSDDKATGFERGKDLLKKLARDTLGRGDLGHGNRAFPACQEQHGVQSVAGALGQHGSW